MYQHREAATDYLAAEVFLQPNVGPTVGQVHEPSAEQIAERAALVRRSWLQPADPVKPWPQIAP